MTELEEHADLLVAAADKVRAGMMLDPKSAEHLRLALVRGALACDGGGHTERQMMLLRLVDFAEAIVEAK